MTWDCLCKPDQSMPVHSLLLARIESQVLVAKKVGLKPSWSCSHRAISAPEFWFGAVKALILSYMRGYLRFPLLRRFQTASWVASASVAWREIPKYNVPTSHATSTASPFLANCRTRNALTFHHLPQTASNHKLVV